MTPSLTPDPTSPGAEGEEMRTLAELSAAASAGEWRYSPGPNFDEADIVATVNGYPAEISNFYCATGADEFEALPGKANAAFVAALVNSYRSGPLARLHSDLTAAREERDREKRWVEFYEKAFADADRLVTHMSRRRQELEAERDAAEAEIASLRERVAKLERSFRDVIAAAEGRNSLDAFPRDKAEMRERLLNCGEIARAVLSSSDPERKP